MTYYEKYKQLKTVEEILEQVKIDTEYLQRIWKLFPDIAEPRFKVIEESMNRAIQELGE